MKSKLKKSQLTWILLSLLVVTAVLLVQFFRDAKQGTLAFEVAKSLLQLGVVAVASTAISLAIADRDLDRRRDEYREELLTATLSRTMAAYSGAKRARRLLRARSGAVTGGSGVTRLEDYDRFMEVVNDAQLEFENVKGDVNTSRVAFSSADSVFAFLESIEKYLGVVIKEYEKTRYTISDPKSSLQVGHLKELSDFLGPVDTSRFKCKVIDPYHEIQKLIRADLVYPRLPHLPTHNPAPKR